MSQLSLKKIKLGDSADTSKNFLIKTPAVADGTLTIERENGTDVLTIDASGNIRAAAGASLVGNGPAFRVYASTAVTVFGTADVKVNFDTKAYDTNSAFDLTNDRFQPTVAGYYQITGNISVAGGTSAIIASIRKNGALHSVGPSPTANRTNVADLVYLNGAGDYVELWGYSSTSQNSASGFVNMYFSGFLARAA